MHDMQPDNLNTAPEGAEHDNEGAMARADLYKLANYSLKLFKKLQDGDQLESWVQAKITKAADYIASVYHYLEYEMEFSEFGAKLENSGIYSESQKAEIKNKLMEARQKMSELKKIQAEKIAGKSVSESHVHTCDVCGGSGHVEREIPEELKAKVRAYNKKAKAMSAAISRVDRNKNGIPDALEKGGEEVTDEDQSNLKKTGDSYKTSAGGTVTKTATGIKHERDPNSYDDGGDELDSMAKSGKGGKSHAKAMSAAEKKDRAPAQKKSKSGTWGMEGGEKFDNRKKEKAVDETFGQGVYAEGKADKDYDGDGKVESDKDEVWGSRAKAAAKSGKPFGKDKKVDEELTDKQRKLDVDDDGDIEADDLADLRANKKEKKVDEGKPSAGMTKKEKSSTVKAAKAGKDIGKPGKNFDKVAKAAGGGEKGKKIAAAAMWKNKAKSLKESLEAMLPEQQIEEAEDQDLVALIQRAQEVDPQGLAQAQQQGPGALQQFLTGVLQKIEAKVDADGQQGQPTQAGTTPAQPAQPAATMGTSTGQEVPQTVSPEGEKLSESTDFNRLLEFRKRLIGL